jgi:hypothetical protein
VTVRDQGSDEAPQGGRSDLLARVRELDPESSRENVKRFFREIDAATKVLQQIDTSSYPLPVAYDPHWTRDPQ